MHSIIENIQSEIEAASNPTVSQMASARDQAPRSDNSRTLVGAVCENLPSQATACSNVRTSNIPPELKIVKQAVATTLIESRKIFGRHDHYYGSQLKRLSR